MSEWVTSVCVREERRSLTRRDCCVHACVERETGLGREVVGGGGLGDAVCCSAVMRWKGELRLLQRGLQKGSPVPSVGSCSSSYF